MRLYISITQQSNNQFEARELMGTYLHNVKVLQILAEKEYSDTHWVSYMHMCQFPEAPKRKKYYLTSPRINIHALTPENLQNVY